MGPLFATSGGVYRRIHMWAYPWRNAKKANKAKVPSDNHAKPSRKSKKSKKNKVFRRMQVGAYHLALPHEILLFLLW